MSMLTLAISSVTISNSPWLMDLIVQVPVQCCSWQHQTSLSSPDTSRTGHCFCFGWASSFLLELFFQSSVAYWTPTELGSSSFSVISFCLFVLSMGFSRQECWSGLPFPLQEYLLHMLRWGRQWGHLNWYDLISQTLVPPTMSLPDL